MTRRRDDSAPHHIADLLPGYVNGTLDGAETARVRAHLQRCAGCRVELAAWQSLATATRSAEGAVPEPAHYLLDRVIRAIDENDQAASRAFSSQTAATRPTTFGMKRTQRSQEPIMELTNTISPAGGLQPITGRRGGRTGGWHRLRGAEFAAAAVVALMLVAGYLALRTAPPPGGDGGQGSMPGLAQRGTPDPDLMVEIPDYCTVEPRKAGELGAILDVPLDDNGVQILPTPIVQGQPPEILPEGTPADAATLEAVNAVWSDYWMCVATGDRLGSYALLTDDGVRRVFYRSDQSNEPPAWAVDVVNEEAAATPAVPDELEKAAPRPAIMLGEARVLADGRVAALLYPGTATQFEAAGYVVFLQVDGRWLIDDFTFYVG